MKTIDYTQSAAWLARAEKVLAGGVSSEFRKRSYPHAMFYSSGKGCFIQDVDGNEYLDFTLSQGPLILGHSHPKVLEAVRRYTEEGQLFAGQHTKEIELAEKLNQLIPSAEMMRFCLDGSEAIQTAIRLARAKTGKQKFLRFEGHYHGWLDNVAWGIASPDEDALGERAHPHQIPWSEGLFEQSREESILLPWNDLKLLEQTVAERHDEIAAVITEPVMCNNGCIMPRDGYLQGIRDLCDRYGITFILDEVITGFRMSIGGAQSYFGVTPDLSIFGKAMGSGYPISAVVGRKDWMKLIEDSKVIHAGTMNSSNPTVAAALATIEVLERENPYPRLFDYGNTLMEGLRQAAKESGQHLLVQGPGPMFITTFGTANPAQEYRDTLRFDKAKTKEFISRMHDNHIRIIGRGLWYISAAHREKNIQDAIEIAGKVLRQMH